MSYKNWSLEKDSEHICWLHLDVSDTSTNVLRSDVLQELEEILTELAQSLPTAIVFVSDKPMALLPVPTSMSFYRSAPLTRPRRCCSVATIL